MEVFVVEIARTAKVGREAGEVVIEYIDYRLHNILFFFFQANFRLTVCDTQRLRTHYLAISVVGSQDEL